MTLKTGGRRSSQNAYGSRETGMHEDNWCHCLWSLIFSHEDGYARQEYVTTMSLTTEADGLLFIVQVHRQLSCLAALELIGGNSDQYAQPLRLCNKLLAANFLHKGRGLYW